MTRYIPHILIGLVVLILAVISGKFPLDAIINAVQEHPEIVAYSITLAAIIYTLRYRWRRDWLVGNARAAIFWVLALLVVVWLYSQQDALKQALLPSQPQQERESIRIQRSADGHFYIDAHINNQPITFMVDTGASDIVLAPQDAERLGYPLRNLEFNGRAYTAGGMVRIASITLHTLDIANHSRTEVAAKVNGSELRHSLLGMRYLSEFSRITINNTTLTLEF